MSANSLDKVPTSQLQNLGRLEELTLGKNFFPRLSDHALKGLRKLRILDLSECPELAEVTSLARRRLQPGTGDTEQAQEDTGQLWLVSGLTILSSDWSVW